VRKGGRVIATEIEYEIDGERYTLEVIVDRAAAAGLSRAQVRSRLHYGDRSWARLLRTPSNKPKADNRLFFGAKRGGRLPK
jgi:hypothetical protein